MFFLEIVEFLEKFHLIYKTVNDFFRLSMGHRKHSQPRRGSMAYSPRGRAKSMEARIRAWPQTNSDDPQLLAHAGFKAGCVQLVSLDDREHVPNYGKQMVVLGTVIVTPPLVVIGIRGYTKNANGRHAKFDVFTKDTPKNIEKLIKIKPEDEDLVEAEKLLGKVKEIYAIVAITPRLVGLEQKTPYIFEVGVKGGDIQKQFTKFKNSQFFSKSRY